MPKFLKKIHAVFTDVIAKCIATWTFIFIYTTIMIAWITLHAYGILNIDSSDFIRYNLFLSWAAGIQASIILMTSNRQSAKDREKLIKGIELDQKVLDLIEIAHQFDVQNVANIKKQTMKLNSLNEKIEKMDELLNLMEKEEEDKHGKE